jgi:hypothetical protein
MTHANCHETLRSDEAERRSDTELVARILCRLERLKQLGCNSRDCLVLAARLDLDVDRAVELVGRGCRHDLVVRILV